jgi:hypothetical protein
MYKFGHISLRFRLVGLLLYFTNPLKGHYPGFPLQSIAVAFSQHFLTFLFFSASLLFMVWYAKSGKKRYAWLALATCLVQVFTMEYFAALELIRPLLLWILFARAGAPWAQTVRKVVKVWWIFLIPLAAYAFFRFFGTVQKW